MPLRLTTYGRSEDIPPLPGKNVFHSTELFRVLEQTDVYRPLLAVAYDGDEPVGKLLCIIRRKSRWLRISYKTFSYGTGEYFGKRWKPEEVFGEILTYLTRYYGGYSWMVEFRNLEDSLFGYRYFRQNGYFPIRWLRVRNSLHHHRIDKWMSQSRRRQIQRGLANGAVMEEVESEADIRSLFTMLDHYYSSKLHHYFPDIGFFLSLLTESSGKKKWAKCLRCVIKDVSSAVLSVCFLTIMLICFFPVACGKVIRNNTPVYWLYGRRCCMHASMDMIILSSWMPDFRSAS